MIDVVIDGRTLSVAPDTLLSDALGQAGLTIPMPCAGRGTCGKCAVWARGALSPATQAERQKLAALAPAAAPGEGFTRRLACYTRAQGPCEVLRIRMEGVAVELGGTHPEPLTAGADEPLGFAVDIGTTTVAAKLYGLTSGAALGALGALNSQAAFGADVLSRIAYADQHGHAVPGDAIRAQLEEMMRQLLAQAGADAARVSRLVITGNTTMLHFVAGLDPHGIGISPFTPQSLFGVAVPAASVFPFLPAGATLYYPPCVSAYVGADIACGMLACGLLDGADNRLLVDVGTNGEMALRAGGRLLCCATAAGPAFEGAQIEMGMPASSGAISRVWTDGRQVLYTVIGGSGARGVCGTGLLGAVRTMRLLDILDETGMMEEERFDIADSGVYISGQDVRALQLAKSAIAAGIATLLHIAGITPEHLAATALAGGFGSVLDPHDAAAISLIPEALTQGAYPAGNLALDGAARLLLAWDTHAALERATRAAIEVPLATNPYFMQQYMDQMMFPEVAQ